MLRDYAIRSPERCVWRRTANLIGAEWGASYPKISKALRMSGLYPRRTRGGHAAWHVEPAGWWVPERVLGSYPPRARELCPTCGRMTGHAVRPPP